MMTNSEAIKLIEGILPQQVSYANLVGASSCYGDKYVYESPEPYALELAISALKENDKLKAEVEQFSNELISVRIENELLKKKNELTNYYFEQYAAAIDEIEKLKSELEQSVRLPCKVGDNIYFRVKGRNQFAEYVDFIQTQKITRIYIDEDGTLYCSATEKFTECDINKTIFLTREEAERHLKGKVENDKLRTN